MHGPLEKLQRAVSLYYIYIFKADLHGFQAQPKSASSNNAESKSRIGKVADRVVARSSDDIVAMISCIDPIVPASRMHAIAPVAFSVRLKTSDPRSPSGQWSRQHRESRVKS